MRRVRIAGGPALWQFIVTDAETGEVIPCSAINVHVDYPSNTVDVRLTLLDAEFDLTVDAVEIPG